MDKLINDDLDLTLSGESLFYLCHLDPRKFIRLLLNTQILYKNFFTFFVC